MTHTLAKTSVARARAVGLSKAFVMMNQRGLFKNKINETAYSK